MICMVSFNGKDIIFKAEKELHIESIVVCVRLLIQMGTILRILLALSAEENILCQYHLSYNMA